ncbi:hypothetical protein L7F22_069198 [Adiantum nelumboides]|nr:hypothetical protein [Adiantum nelumboides]
MILVQIECCHAPQGGGSLQHLNPRVYGSEDATNGPWLAFASKYSLETFVTELQIEGEAAAIMSKLQSDVLREAITVLVSESKEKFVETVELHETGLKNYDP